MVGCAASSERDITLTRPDENKLRFVSRRQYGSKKGSESRIARSSLSNARSSVCAARRCLRINFTIHQKRMFWQLFLQSPNVWRRKIPSRRGQPCVKRMVVVSFEEHDLHMLAASWPAGFAVLRVGGCHIRSGWEWSRCLGAELATSCPVRFSISIGSTHQPAPFLPNPTAPRCTGTHIYRTVQWF